MEVMEEEELAEIRAKQVVFEEVRDAELAEVERLEELNRRRRLVFITVSILAIHRGFLYLRFTNHFHFHHRSTTVFPDFVRREEQKRRREQAEYAAMMKRQTAERIAARSYVKAYLEPLLPNTFEMLTARGFFYDDVRLGEWHS